MANIKTPAMAPATLHALLLYITNREHTSTAIKQAV